MASDDKLNMENSNKLKIFDLIQQGSNEEVKAHFKASRLKVDCLDSKGMTPLQMAAFRGNKELCEFFLANGADVNSNHHENSYSALMFAALSGKTDVVRCLLEAGANTSHTNSVKRTAAQMAAFVGQHQSVSVINNFFPQSEINYYTKPQGLETEAKLPPSVAPSLCALINFGNIHPVKISLYLKEHPEIVSESKKVCLVLSRIIEKNMKTREVNDIVALKCHFISTVVKHAADSREKDKENSLNSWLKTLMKGNDKSGFMEFQERLIRQSLKDFPFVNSALLQQLVRQLAPVPIGSQPTALSLLISSVNGQQYAWDASEGCDTCGEAKAEAKCSKCKMVVYCNQYCQKLHWPTHKKFCASLAEEYKRREEEKVQYELEEKRKQEEQRKKLDELEKAEKNSEKKDSNSEENGIENDVENAEDREVHNTEEKEATSNKATEGGDCEKSVLLDKTDDANTRIRTEIES